MLSDLLDSRQDDRIQLNLQQNNNGDANSQRGQQKRPGEDDPVSGLENGIERRRTIREIQDEFDQSWEPRLEGVSKERRIASLRLARSSPTVFTLLTRL